MAQGTGKGYDTIYADLNFNGDLSGEQPIEGTVKAEGNRVQGSFPPIDVSVPYNEKAQGIANPCQLEICYYQFGGGEETQRHFQLRANVKVKLEDDEEVEWIYSFSNELLPAEKPEGVIAAAFGGELRLMPLAMPDREKEGHAGIGASVTPEVFVVDATGTVVYHGRITTS